MNSIKSILKSYQLQVHEIEKLEGYASLNYKLKTDNANYLLKHYLDESELEIISEEEKIIQFLSEQNLPFHLPAGLDEINIHPDGSFSRLLPFIEGELLAQVTHNVELIENFGAAIATLNTHSLDLKSSPIKAREHCWDMKHTLLNSKKIDCILDPADRKIVAYYLDQFEFHVQPIQHELRHSIIHSDLNDNNVIVENNRINGIIDFGDIAYSPLIYEVAIALTYLLMANENDGFIKAQAFLKGYHDILPLTKEEVELLSVLIPSRLCVSVCNSAEKKTNGEATEYVLISEKPAWNLLRKWVSINPIWIRHFFLDTLSFKREQVDAEALIKQRKKLTGRSLKTSYEEPIYMTGGAFQFMYDHLGNTYLDAYNNVAHLGHSHPAISKIISKHTRKLNTNTRYIYPELTEYAAELTKTLPDSLQKFFYVNSGSSASDLAIRMARLHTNQSSIAILKNGYHGNTSLGIEISDYKHNGKGGTGQPEHIITLPLPKMFLGTSKTGEEYANEAIDLLDLEIKHGNKPAALIVEPISGCGGQVPLADGYLKKLHEFLKKNEILLIADEVQTGFGRLGNWFWGFEMQEVIPDIVITGKPMGNGHPVASVITTETVSESFANGMEFFTSFGGNPVSCAVALEVLKTIKQENLQANALEVGAYLKKNLLELKDGLNCIADVRGEGLFLGIEFSDDLKTSSTVLAQLIKEDLKRNFILVGTDGPLNNVIKIKPPMCFSLNDAKHLLDQLKKSIQTSLT